MKHKLFYIALGLVIMGISMNSCNWVAKRNDAPTPLIPPHCDDDNSNDLRIELPNDDIVDVSYTESCNLKIVQVLINDCISKEMIFDTGASYTQITKKEAIYLYNEKVLTADDIVGKERIYDANGNITVNTVVNLRKLVLGGKLIIANVQATVVENADAPLLLGQTVLKRLPQYTVDNTNKVIKFKIK